MTDEHYDMIKRLAKLNLGKGTFANNFITSLAQKERSYTLTPAQIESLERLKRRNYRQYHRVKL